VLAKGGHCYLKRARVTMSDRFLRGSSKKRSADALGAAAINKIQVNLNELEKKFNLHASNEMKLHKADALKSEKSLIEKFGELKAMILEHESARDTNLQDFARLSADFESLKNEYAKRWKGFILTGDTLGIHFHKKRARHMANAIEQDDAVTLMQMENAIAKISGRLDEVAQQAMNNYLTLSNVLTLSEGVFSAGDYRITAVGVPKEATDAVNLVYFKQELLRLERKIADKYEPKKSRN
jgi:hypothetical protein